MKNNQINIEDNRRIKSIQEEFNAIFPYLKLEFYVDDANNTPLSSRKIRLIDGRTIADCRNIHNSGVITIFPEMSVLDMENIFFQSFGISVQVLRKAGNIWQQTSHTDSWSLEEQNRQGEIVSTYIGKQKMQSKGE